MTATFSNIINAYHTNFVNSCSAENLKNFCIAHKQDTEFPKGAFSRNRKMNLTELMGFLLMPRAESNVLELVRYSRLIDRDNVNKSNFSQRRRLIPHGYIHELLTKDVESYYESNPKPATYQGRLIIAGDGTTYSIPNVPRLKEAFLQGRKTGRGEQPLARGVVLYDVLNHVVVEANMDCYGKDEIKLLNEGCAHLPGVLRSLNPLLVLDRKYCAYTLIYSLLRDNLDFVIRVKSGFSPQLDDFMSSEEKERIVTLTPGGTTRKKLTRLFGQGDYSSLTVRACRMGNVVVITSVLDSAFDLDPDDSPNIYHLRWDDETVIGFCKNNLQIEIFSSTSKDCLLQDFYAKIIAYNYLSLYAGQAAELRRDSILTKTKYDMAIDKNIALGLMKMNWVNVLDPFKINNSTEKLLKMMGRFMVSVRPNRHNHRAFRKIKHSGKYITLTNYARAL